MNEFDMSGVKAKHDFSRLYLDVKRDIEVAMQEVGNLNVEHKEGKVKISEIEEVLRGISDRFQHNLADLDENAEWDKFALAFFGETNAGKSTIIESLRILFSEESRQQVLEQNKRALTCYQNELTEHAERVCNALRGAYEQHAVEIRTITENIHQLKSIRKRDRFLAFCIGAGVAIFLPMFAIVLLGMFA
jgi:hypothetical protein